MRNDTHIRTIVLPPFAQRALSLLEEHGFEAWCVGGFVRDALLGREGSDIDIATDASWEVVRDIFTERAYRVIETGSKHGTVTVLIEGNPLEITTYRREGDYSDKRHPDAVFFIQDITQDLARRDFTMNALAFHPERGFCDPYGGRKDIRQRMIRSVGDPRKRFDEDALRILRACRFASELGFSLEAATEEAMCAQQESLCSIAAERIQRELDKLFRGTSVHKALMNYFSVISQVIPEAAPLQNFDQRTPYHIYDVLEHSAYCMQACSSTSLVRWAAFFHDVGKPATFLADEAGVGHFYGHAKVSAELAGRAMERLKVSPSFIRDVQSLVLHHDDLIAPTHKAVKRMLRRLDGRTDLFRALCDLKRGDSLAHAPQYRDRAIMACELEKILDDILEKEEAFSLKNLAVTGNDLKDLGIPEGRKLGFVLESLLNAVIDEKVANNPDELLSLARSIDADMSSED